MPKYKHIFIGIFLVLLSLTVGYTVGAKGFEVNLAKAPSVTINRATPEANLDFSLFWKVWDSLNSSYFDKSKVVPSQMVYGAIQGMVASLGDPYTMFLLPSQNKITNDDLQGNFSGVGIELGYKGSQLAVVAPLSGSPADEAGIKAGDLILGIKDEAKKVDITTENINLALAVENIRGPEGSKVTLTLFREGTDSAFPIDLVRAKINVPSVTIDYLGEKENIAHLSILKFGGNTLSEWSQAVNNLTTRKPEVTKIILDLRNNPGGYLQDAIDIAAEFLPKDSIVVIQEAGSGSKTYLKTDRVGKLIDTKVVVLVNGGSASASEILAGALKDNKQIKLVGDKTFGKGTIQEPEDLTGGAGLHITIAKWLTPNGTWVHGTGLTPDVVIANSPDEETDTQLNEAIKLVESL